MYSVKAPVAPDSIGAAEQGICVKRTMLNLRCLDKSATSPFSNAQGALSPISRGSHAFTPRCTRLSVPLRSYALFSPSRTSSRQHNCLYTQLEPFPEPTPKHPSPTELSTLQSRISKIQGVHSSAMAQSNISLHATSTAPATSPAQPITVAHSDDGLWFFDERTQAPRILSGSKATKRKRAKEALKSAQMSTATIIDTTKENDTSGPDGGIESYAVPPRKKQKKGTVLVEAKDGDKNHSAVEAEAAAIKPALTASNKTALLKKLIPTQEKKTQPTSDAMIKAFLDAIPHINSWTSSKIKEGPCKIIEWLDKDGVSMERVVELYNAMGHGNQDPKKPTGNPKTNIYKVYNRWAPDFYKEQGIVFVRLHDRKKYLEGQEKKASKSSVKKPKSSKPKAKPMKEDTLVAKPWAKMPAKSNAAHSKSAPAQSAQRDEGRLDVSASQSVPAEEGSPKDPYIPTLDDELRGLFAQKFNAGHGASPSRRMNPRTILSAIRPANNEALKGDIARYSANWTCHDLLSFKRRPADLPYGDPARPVLDRQAAAQYSEFLREQLSHEPGLEMIEYADSVRSSTISRFVACISPTLRTDLPTHDLIEVDEDGERLLLQTPIGWSMTELQELYLFALQMKCGDVCDMILDQWHEEFRRSAPQIVVDAEFGEETEFNILDISPEFLNILAVTDMSGLYFFTSLLVLKKEGQNVLESLGVENWSDTIKLQLKEKLELRSPRLLETMHADDFCQQFHHHNHGDRQHEYYKAHAVVAKAMAGLEGGQPFGGTGKMGRMPAKPDPKLFQDMSFGGKTALRKYEQKRAEQRRKHEHHLEALADYEAAAKSITLDALPNLAFPIVFHDPVHTLEEKKEKVVPFLYPEELGNGPDDRETAKKKQDFVWAKLEDFAKAHGVKNVDALVELFGLVKGGKHAPRTSNDDDSDSGEEEDLEGDDE
ncbi:hypothetical protein BKA63DRAFT_557578 [Paraphoma chrysanthemicola]|nr:hypothetical protein BKA63DRAFT_557578 [Paraphoma chrysanthemicola]